MLFLLETRTTRQDLSTGCSTWQRTPDWRYNLPAQCNESRLHRTMAKAIDVYSGVHRICLKGRWQLYEDPEAEETWLRFQHHTQDCQETSVATSSYHRRPWWTEQMEWSLNKWVGCPDEGILVIKSKEECPRPRTKYGKVWLTRASIWISLDLWSF